MKKILFALSACTIIGLTGCGPTLGSSIGTATENPTEEQVTDSSLAEDNGTDSSLAKDNDTDNSIAEDNGTDSSDLAAPSSENGIINTSELFTERDLKQTAELDGAITYTVSDGKDIHITEEGVYVINGTATNATIYIEADSQAKVQIVLDGVSITNDNLPCIYVKEADKVFVTTTNTKNHLSVTGSFTTDGNVNTDGVIFSKSDLVLNGTGTLTVDSTEHGIVSKDDLKITGGTYEINSTSKAFDANDSIRIANGTFYINAGTDGFHTEGAVWIEGGAFDIQAAEGIEGTYIQINDGDISIQASDDGINATNKSSAYDVMVEINGGEITIAMGAGDTDGIDSNCDIIINGGTIDITGNSSFDYDGNAQLNGGTVIVNGQQVEAIPNQMMGGMGGNRHGNMEGGMGGNRNGNMEGGMGGNRHGGMGGRNHFDMSQQNEL